MISDIKLEAVDIIEREDWLGLDIRMGEPGVSKFRTTLYVKRGEPANQTVISLRSLADTIESWEEE